MYNTPKVWVWGTSSTVSLASLSWLDWKKLAEIGLQFMTWVTNRSLTVSRQHASAIHSQYSRQTKKVSCSPLFTIYCHCCPHFRGLGRQQARAHCNTPTNIHCPCAFLQTTIWHIILGTALSQNGFLIPSSSYLQNWYALIPNRYAGERKARG